jgi:hypothetical protein
MSLILVIWFTIHLIVHVFSIYAFQKFTCFEDKKYLLLISWTELFVYFKRDKFELNEDSYWTRVKYQTESFLIKLNLGEFNSTHRSCGVGFARVKQKNEMREEKSLETEKQY